MDTPTPEQIAQSQRIWQAQQARDRAERAARRAYLEGLRERLIAEIDTASAALADLNRRTLRDLLRDALAAHPSVSRIALNQYTEYNDDTYVFRLDGFWLDGHYVGLDLGHASVYEPFEDWQPAAPDRTFGPGFSMDTGVAEYARWDEARAFFPPGTPATHPDVLARKEGLEREAYGPLYDVAKDVAARLRTLAPLGRHFWVDGFGYAATIEATREEMRISSAYFSREHGPTEDRSAWLTDLERQSGIPLGNITSAYASDLARAPHVALRLARTTDLLRIESELFSLALTRASDALVVPGKVTPVRAEWEAWGEPSAYVVGPFRVPVQFSGDGQFLPDEAAVEALRQEAAPRPVGPYRWRFDADFEQALRAWAAAVQEEIDRVGHARLVAMRRSA